MVIMEIGEKDEMRGIKKDIKEKNIDEMMEKMKERGI